MHPFNLALPATLHARLDGLRRALQALLHVAYPVGFCGACQRPTEWRDGGATFVCRHCGGDPLQQAPPDET